MIKFYPKMTANEFPPTLKGIESCVNLIRKFPKSFFLLVILFAIQISKISADDRFSDRFLRALYDRSDLVVDAFLVENCEGGMGSGLMPTSKAQITYLGCPLRVQINRVLKGECSIVRPFYIDVTVPLSDKAPRKLPQKGERYFFFLEDRLKREPKSHHAIGDEIVNFRTFDLWFGAVPGNDALGIKLSGWAKEEETKDRSPAQP